MPLCQDAQIKLHLCGDYVRPAHEWLRYEASCAITASAAAVSRARSIEVNAYARPDGARVCRGYRVLGGPIVGVSLKGAVRCKGIAGQESGRCVLLVRDIDQAGEDLGVFVDVVSALKI